MARGQLPGGTDIELAVDQLAGPVYYRVLVTRESVPRSYTDTLVDRYLAPGPGPDARTSTSTSTDTGPR